MGTRKQDDLVLEAKRTRTRPPPLFKVMLLNDDYTPMDFVIVVLQKYFGMDRERATRVMLQCTERAWGYAASFPGTSPRPRWSRSPRLLVSINIRWHA